ncbi:uncharacterized protein [Oryza sativa Japonica Group]|uniref:Os06g0165300 protein n=1 Tax=Oryza sativa subsp. japonica TaxID=39947 RepID=Q0DEA2_ORYSJ|nr:uncharacterized protein LOC4340237 [Oryza sativa Japonica Group]EAZ35942.1 hypothetical protein OsJ_20246 [Oryza sativa Japonica Group]KAF2925371.1 hypothetical protein DAI22_06g046800 [Oryza sativa Japonica Group]BAF18821.1 Os06g0165300 [Oryza sativa Japonica Group]|eukprot:NP_001056907.1 Os06g0165300 [Oryza sativa Japonica Group]
MHSSSSSSSSSVEIIDADAFSSPSADDAAAAVDSPPAPSRSIADRIASSLRTQEAVDALCKKHGVPKGFAARPAGDLRACSTPPPGAVCVYKDALEAGMRVPLHPFACDVLRHFGLAPSEVTPNGWRIMAGFLVLSHHAGVPPSLAVFRHFFKLCLFKSNGWYHFRGKDTVGLLFTGMPTHLKGWKEGFFFLSSSAPWPCQVRWGGPPSKSSIADPVLTGEEEKWAAKLLDKHRAAVDLRTYLTESNLAAAFSSNPAAAASPQPPPPSRSTRAEGMDPSVFEMMMSMRAEKAAAAQAPATAQKVKTEPESDTPRCSPSSVKKRKFEAEANAKDGTPPTPHGFSCSASGLSSPPPGFSAQKPTASDQDRKPMFSAQKPTASDHDRTPGHVPDKHDGDTADWKAARQLLQGIVTPSRERQFPAAKPSDVVASSYVTLLQAANYATFSLDYALELEERLRARERDAAAEADAMRKEVEEKAQRGLAAAKAAAVQEYVLSEEHKRELAAHALEGYERGMEDMRGVALRLSPRLDAARLVVPPGRPD